MRLFLEIFCATALLTISFTLAFPVENNEQDDSPNESVKPINEDEENNDKSVENLTPSQQGRLARFSGNFFQLYGATNQKKGEVEGDTGNLLGFRGNLIEFLGNEINQRALSEALDDAKYDAYGSAERKTGREKELVMKEGDLFGKLSQLVSNSADKEHEQAKSKAHQFNLEAENYKLDREVVNNKVEEAATELDQSDLEKEQIKLENEGRGVMVEIIKTEEELETVRNEDKNQIATTEEAIQTSTETPAPTPA